MYQSEQRPTDSGRPTDRRTGAPIPDAVVEDRRQGSDRRRASVRARSMLPLAASWLVATVLLAIVSLQQAVPLDDLFLDATAVSGSKWYFGLVTSLGVLAWTVSVAGCVATAFVTKLGDRHAATNAFRGAAFLFTLLLLDDLFLLHSNLLPAVTGVPKLGFL